MKAKPRDKSTGLARVGKAILGAALLAVDQIREKLSQAAEEPKPKAKAPRARKVATAKSPKAAPRKKSAAKRATSKPGEAPKSTPARSKPSARKKGA
jgi:hypothetical protein